MAIFPISPSIGQEETVLGRTFVYDGNGWVAKISGGHSILDENGDTVTQADALQFKRPFKVTSETGKTVVSKDYIQPISFAITDTFTFKPAYALSITGADVSSNIIDLRVGKNGAAPATIVYPYTVSATDIITLEVSFTDAYNRELSSFITLKGQYV